MKGPRLERADRIRYVVRQFQVLIRELDSLQVGDYRNEISPIKHAIAEALTPEIMKLAEIATREHYEEG